MAVRRLLRLYALYAKMDFHWFTQDTRGCLLCVFSDLVSNLSSLFGIFVLAMRFQGVGGLTSDEILWMLGFFTLSDGLGYMLFGGSNVIHISRRIGRGQVDHMLVQPLPLSMQLMTEGFMPVSGSAGFLMGVLLTVLSGARLNLPVTPFWLLLLLACLILRVILTGRISYLAGAAAFYHPVSCEELSSVALDFLNVLGKYPLSGLPPLLTGALITCLPAGLMAWLPSLLLLNKMQSVCAPLLLLFTVTAVFCALSTYLFRKGLHHYAKNSCPRYREMGHRN